MERGGERAPRFDFEGSESALAAAKLRDLARRLPFVPHLELVLLVFGALVEGPVISEPPDVVELVEALDVVGHPVPLQHVLALWNGRHGVNLQVCACRRLREASGRATRKTTPSPKRFPR